MNGKQVQQAPPQKEEPKKQNEPAPKVTQPRGNAAADGQDPDPGPDTPLLNGQTTTPSGNPTDASDPKPADLQKVQADVDRDELNLVLVRMQKIHCFGEL